MFTSQNTGELRFLDAIDYLIAEHDKGHAGDNRTAVKTTSIFGLQCDYDLSGMRLPLFTSKKTHFTSILLELLWFISGSTDTNELSTRGCRIWDANSTRDFLDGRGLTSYQEGDIGPGYGFQWRHAGEKYKGKDADYKSKGIDQLGNCLDTLINDPSSRRNIISAWCPVMIDEMALPPCHLLSQYLCGGANMNELTCVLFQRSGDMGLGVPFNVASYAILTHLLASLSGKVAVRLVHFIADAHLYANHVENMRGLDKTFVANTKKPILEINNLNFGADPFGELTVDQFKVKGYKFSKRVKLDMVV